MYEDENNENRSAQEGIGNGGERSGADNESGYAGTGADGTQGSNPYQEENQGYQPNFTFQETQENGDSVRPEDDAAKGAQEQGSYSYESTQGSYVNQDGAGSGYGSQGGYYGQSNYGSNNNYSGQDNYGSGGNYGGQSNYGNNNNYSGQDNYGSSNNYGGQNNYGAYDDNISRWEPDQDKYNSYDPGKVVTVKKSGRRWWIPVVIILAVLVVAIGVLAFVLLNKIDFSIATVETETEAEEIETVETVESTTTSSSGIVLTDVSDVVESVMPSVVSITSRTIVESNSYGDIWSYFYGNGSGSSSEAEEVESGIGSGTIVGQNDTELLILTSYHVVEDCSSLYVTFNDDSYVDGYIKSYAEDYDLAVVAVPLEDISSETLSAIKIATLCTEEVEVGEGIIVIGDALGYGQSVVTGIISATNRSITVDNITLTVLQTDAAINSGNSGGCVLNANGEIVGVSEAKIQDTSVEGMCYAIPIYDNYDLIQSLLTAETETDSSDDTGVDSELETIPSSAEDSINSGTDDSASSSTDDSETQGAYLGIYGRDIDSDIASSYGLAEGVYVAEVISGGGAEAAGIQSGDIIVGADGQDLTTMDELQAILADHSAGDTIDITVLRLQNSEYVEITLEVTLTAQLSE